MQVKLFKKVVEYTTQAGEKKTATNFFVECGDQLIPVEVKYFEDKETHTDKNYRVRRSLMSAFAEELPDREKPVSTGSRVEEKATVNDPTA